MGKMSEVISTKVVKTRKPHVCFGCGREFPAGAQMRKDFVHTNVHFVKQIKNVKI